jgi:hypothetical protein
MEWDWKHLRFILFQALDCIKVHDIYLIDRDNNVVTICLIVEEMDKIRPLTKMNIIDKLIEKNSPELYAQFLFCYEVWDKKSWDAMPVAKFFNRRETLP